MTRDDLTRLRHMLDAAREALAFIENKTRNTLDSDRVLALALVKSIEIMGEAAAKVTQECRDTHGNPMAPNHCYETPTHTRLLRH